MHNKSEYFSGIRFDHYTMDELLSCLFNNNDYVVVTTPNVDHVVRAHNNQSLIDLYNASNFCVNDSRVLRNMTMMFGYNLGTVVPGSDLTKMIITKLSGKDNPITIIGCDEKGVEEIKKKYQLKEVSHYNPPMGFIHEEEEVERCLDYIESHPSQFIFLAVGSPRQEILALKAKERNIKGVALCIGASLLFLSGEEKRAPIFIQKLSLEWLFRLFQSPSRMFKRYFIDCPKIIPILIREKKGC